AIAVEVRGDDPDRVRADREVDRSGETQQGPVLQGFEGRPGPPTRTGGGPGRLRVAPDAKLLHRITSVGTRGGSERPADRPPGDEPGGRRGAPPSRGLSQGKTSGCWSSMNWLSNCVSRPPGSLPRPPLPDPAELPVNVLLLTVAVPKL